MSDREKLLAPCTTADALHAWAKEFTHLHLPRQAVCEGHDAPFDYLRSAYFEPAKDLVIWAPRGGGKTRLGALATLLDLLHKPGCAVRILGGSGEQSMRMWEHLWPDLERLAGEEFDGKPKAGSVRLKNGSSCGVLTQSQRAVRGLRLQKLRCDEVELFDPEVWEAAQLVTRSIKQHGQDGDAAGGSSNIAGVVEAFSTLHRPYGLMSRVVAEARERGVRVIKWCLLEVLERCPAERDCATCPLWDECRGVAKSKCDGFVSIDDAIAMKRRVSRETWEAEMLCRRPSRKEAVFPTFNVDEHVAEEIAASADDPVRWLGIDFGFANPFVCLWIQRRGDVSFVVDEYVQPMRLVEEHIAHIRQRPWGTVRRVACDPAGNGRNEQTAQSNVALLRRAGFIVKSRGSQIVAGLELIRAALLSGSGEKRLFIHPRCKRLIAAMTGYHYADGGSELPVKDGVYDHLVDALRYYFVNTSVREGVKERRY